MGMDFLRSKKYTVAQLTTKTDLSFVLNNGVDTNTLAIGYYVNNPSGALSVNSTYVTTPFFKVNPNTLYSSWKDSGATLSMARIAFYDANMNVISVVSDVLTATSPSNAVYCRVSTTTSYYSGTDRKIMFKEGSTWGSYSPYGYTYSNPYLKASEINVTKEKLPINRLNLLDADIKLGYSLLNTSSTPSVDAGFNVTGYMKVNSGEVIIASDSYHNGIDRSLNTMNYVTAFDANKALMSTSGASNVTSYTVPTGVSYVRITSGNAMFNVGYDLSPMIEAPATGKRSYYFPYVAPYAQFSQSKFTGQVNALNIFLPSTIYCASGRTIELYNNQVCPNADKYYIQWLCSVGTSSKRKFSIVGSDTNIGVYPLIFNVYDSTMTLIGTASTSLKIVANTLPNSYTCIPIGDSMTDAGATWLYEVQETLSSQGITFVGTRSTSKNAVTLYHEGRGGWTSSDYATGVSKDSIINPFYNSGTSAFDWGYYKTQNSVTPSFVMLELGTNGVALDPTNNANAIKAIVDNIRANDVNIKIFVCNAIYRSNQDGIARQLDSNGYSSQGNAFKYYEDMKIFNLMVRLQTLMGAYANVFFIPLALEHDSEYNFGSQAVAVNPRSTLTEAIPLDSVHPQVVGSVTPGYLQFADIMFSVFCGTLT